MKKVLFVFLFCFTALTSFSQAGLIWGLLERGFVRSLFDYSLDRYVLRKAGLNWYERQGIKFLIDNAFESYGYPRVSNPANCLVVEFDGQTNKIGNYCNYPIKISGFAQYIETSDQVIISQCNDCFISPMQHLSFLSPEGPFVAVYYDNSNEAYQSYQTPQSNNTEGIWTKVVSFSNGSYGASLVFELHNSTNSMVGFVVETQSIWRHAKVKIFNDCGGFYGQFNSVTDRFSGISKDMNTPTWIPPGQKIIVSANPNTLQGNSCNLSYAIIDANVFRIGSQSPESMPILVTIKN